MFIKPDWPVPEDIIAFTTTKLGGVSKGDFESLNLSLNVGDDPLSVKKNRKLVEKEVNIDEARERPVWMNENKDAEELKETKITDVAVVQNEEPVTQRTEVQPTDVIDLLGA